MPFQTTPEIDFASVGLVTDIPSHSVPQGGWTSSENVRCKDGTVQGVNIFDNSGIALFNDPGIIGINIVDGISISDTVLVPSNRGANTKSNLAISDGLVITLNNDKVESKDSLSFRDTLTISVGENVLVNGYSEIIVIDDSPVPAETENNPVGISIIDSISSFVDAVEGTYASSIPKIIREGKARAITQFNPAGTNDLVLAFIVEDTYGTGHVVTYNKTTGVWIDITNGIGGNKFTFDDNYPPQIFVFNEMLIVNPAVDAPPQYTDTSVSSGSLQVLPGWLIDEAGSYLVTRSLKPFGNRLMAMNILEERYAGTDDDLVLPIDILWSTHITGIGSLPQSSWQASTVNTAGDAFAVDTPGKILDGGQLGSFFIAYKEDSVIRVSETGDTLVLSFESIFEDDGIYSARCFANIGNSQHLVIGNYGVYMHDGQSQKSDIAKGIFQDTLFDLVKSAEKDKAFCFQQTRDKEVWFCFSHKDNTVDGCDRAFVYDYNQQKLHYRTLPNLSDIYEAELNGELEIYATRPVASGDNLRKLSNSEYESGGWFIKEDDNMQQQNVIKQVNSIFISSEENIKMSILGTQNLKDTKTYSLQTFNASTDYKLDTRANGRYLNIKFEMDGDTNPKMGKIQMDIKQAGTR